MKEVFKKFNKVWVDLTYKSDLPFSKSSVFPVPLKQIYRLSVLGNYKDEPRSMELPLLAIKHWYFPPVIKFVIF